MRNKLVTYAVAGAVGLTAVAGAALVAPAVSYAATGDSAALQERVSGIKDALTGLVRDGTLSQAQADRVASTLAEARPGRPGRPGGHDHGPGGRGPALATAAEALGVTVEELRAAAEAGQSLADVAEQEGVSTDVLVDALVAAGKERLAQGVADGRLTQAEADTRGAELEALITARLDEPLRLERGGHRGHHGPRGGAPQSAPPQAPATASPDA